MKKRALLSVFDKTGIVELGSALCGLGFEIVSTGSTQKVLESGGVPVIGVSEVTGFPECLDGRVKTLNPKIHCGILAMRGNPDHMGQLEELGVNTIDIVVNNLYPFKKTILSKNVTLEEAVENIDIGGPSMLRAAAKNYRDVTVVVDPADYGGVIREIREKGRVSRETNFALAAKVFAHTAHYDALIADYFNKISGGGDLPETLTLTYEKSQEMRYGENPHQKAAFYKEIGDNRGMLSDIVQLHGKELSFNNINDTHGALELCREFGEPTVVACKHSNPCGVGSGGNIYEAWNKAHSSDPKSVFGGIIVCNREVDRKTAEEMSGIFLDIVLAPSFCGDAFEILARKKNIRLLTLGNMDRKSPVHALDLKKVSGGLLVQGIDNILFGESEAKCVTDRKPTDKEMEDLLFTWKIVKYVKSNGIAIGRDGQSLGIGPGQVNRIWACEQAIGHCVENLGTDYLNGAVLASDAFFPLPDCVEAAAKAGITAIIQPGGSLKDSESVAACDRHGIAMVFTGTRHFRH